MKTAEMTNDELTFKRVNLQLALARASRYGRPEGQIRAEWYEARLAELIRDFASEHPDVRLTKTQVHNLRSEISALTEA